VSCPRSGSSLFAKMLAGSGLRTIDDRDLRDVKYPDGYFESINVAMFHKSFEELPRGSHQRITAEPYLRSEYLKSDFVRETFQRAFCQMMEQTIDFLKYPQLALSLDFLFEQFPRAHVIALWREPFATFHSLLKKEFAPDSFATSGLRAIQLWSVYAYHIVVAKQSRPESVTVFNIDELVTKDADLAPFLAALGYGSESPVKVTQSLSKQWSATPSAIWKLYYAGMRVGCSIFASRLSEHKRRFADVAGWRSRLDSLTTHF